MRAPDWRWGFERRLPHPFREARTPGSRQGDSSISDSCAFEIADVASRRVVMDAPELARAARWRATVRGSAGSDVRPTSSHQPVKTLHWVV